MLSKSFISAMILAYSLAAFAGEPLGIHGPDRIGVVTSKPFLYLVPATGGKDIEYSAKGLPSGLVLNSKTGIIEGEASAEGEYNVKLTVRDDSGTATRDVTVVVGKNAIALTPILGWNPWYVWGCNIDDKKIRDAADMLVSSGLAARGYNYINLDDCWQDKRNADGEMIPNKNFPDMKALVDYVHSKGLRIGMYTGPGPKTCGGYQATQDLDYEKGVSYLEKDVQLYARWGFDFIKYDWCIFPKDRVVDAYYKSKQKTLYTRMSEEIEKSSRAMVHMICQYGEQAVWEWGAQVGGNMWRTNHDLADEWPAVLRNGFENISLSPFAGPGHWNDLDMLMIGKANWPMKLGQYDIPGTAPRPTQLTKDEQVSHMTLWSIMASPLLFSGDLTQLDAWTLSLLKNDDMLAINQDALGAPVKKVWDGDKIVLTRPLADGSMAVAMFNLNKTTQKMAFTDQMIERAGKKFSVRNVWTKEVTNSVNKVEAIVPAHGSWYGILNF